MSHDKRQLQLRLKVPDDVGLPPATEVEVIRALAELLLAVATGGLLAPQDGDPSDDE